MRNIWVCIVLLASSGMLLVSCRQHGSEGAESDGVVLYERVWKDPVTSVIGTPSQEKVARWKHDCETLNADRNSFHVECWNEPVDSYVAFSDLDQLRYQHADAGYEEDFEFMCWRLNELFPVAGVDGECARYAALQAQIDSLRSYEPGPTVEMVNMEYTVSDFKMMEARYYAGRMGEAMPVASDEISAEWEAFCVYVRASEDLFKRAVLGEPRYWGTITPKYMACFHGTRAKEYLEGIVPVFLSLADMASCAAGQHVVVRDSRLDAAYGSFRASLRENEPLDADQAVAPEYTLSAKRRALDADRIAWKAWMSARAAVSARLDGELRASYDECTNNVSRLKLISLLNRYKDCDICSESLMSILLKGDCTDSELVSYDYDRAYRDEFGD